MATEKTTRKAETENPATETAAQDGTAIELPALDLGAAEPTPPEPEPPRKRGRKPGSTAGTKKGAELDLKNWAKKVEGLHLIAAKVTGLDLVTIDSEQALALTESVVELARHYDIKPDPVVMAWINLASVVSMVYGPKIYLVAQIKRQQAQERKLRREMDKATQTTTAQPDGIDYSGIGMVN